jgi:hypothetical protein
MEKMRRKYLDCYLHDINNALLAHRDDITEIAHLADLYREKDILTSFFHISNEYYNTLQRNDNEFTGKILDQFISNDKTDLKNNLVCYFEYWETNIDGYKYMSLEGFGECVGGNLVVSQITDGDFLEENNYGGCKEFNDYPDKKQAYIGAKFKINKGNIRIYCISNAFFLFVINRIKSFNQVILSGLDNIVSYKNKPSAKASMLIEYAKQEILDYQRNEYYFWGIPNKIMDSVSQSNKLFLFHRYLLTKEEFEQEWGIMWFSDGNEKSFLLGKVGRLKEIKQLEGGLPKF